MKILNNSFTVSTNKRNELVDITDKVKKVIAESGISEGNVIVYCPHTTAAITINENADPDVVHDILLTLADLIPQNKSGYQHSEGNSDAHVKSSILGCSQTVLIDNGQMQLGTWQGIYFCEFDGPRRRTVLVQITGQ
ncbi:MAG: secondary thiamine-phosphate synthase enzyme YjbQ [Planctomycetes bacterium]|nr:secondary thiamine-phosphate synthase enzyme YjbQ [Planctomycetota bacterium]MBU1517525.1 secondary thiamine-phosphate synthase enzyme YjbQ [Planctomycetota bacterium]MBU2457329.1 secondary thiamine-phosphate synthase enzyme YjbQ [Planctomycetota bacterium]MBU2597267.1 secondary thiamine-phosphate synthase enzyme YjbQ [Planctomycetota bacterium]